MEVPTHIWLKCLVVPYQVESRAFGVAGRKVCLSGVRSRGDVMRLRGDFMKLIIFRDW